MGNREHLNDKKRIINGKFQTIEDVITECEFYKMLCSILISSKIGNRDIYFANKIHVSHNCKGEFFDIFVDVDRVTNYENVEYSSVNFTIPEDKYNIIMSRSRSTKGGK